MGNGFVNGKDNKIIVPLTKRIMYIYILMEKYTQ